MLRMMLPCFAGALLATLSCRSSPPSVRLAHEFEGAYPVDASPSGRTHVFELIADEAELMLVDGVGLRVWAYNGRVPGPTVRVRLGDRVQVKFTNRLPQPTTIHWHGVRVPNGMDGVSHVTQPPIEPGGTFVYDFTPKDAGTFWFHPHLRASEQIERGLYGVLIVDEPEPPPYAEDVVWVLHDWLLDEQRQIVGQFNTAHDLAHDGRWGNTITVNGRTDTTLRVRAGERIRLRIINSSNGRVYAPDLVGLGAKLIAVDGLYLREPIDPGRFEIAPGNRIDLDAFLRGPRKPSHSDHRSVLRAVAEASRRHPHRWHRSICPEVCFAGARTCASMAGGFSGPADHGLQAQRSARGPVRDRMDNQWRSFDGS
jgi:FtsP/CotA-like multicopper oxidase with cupredoxin domain